MELGKRILMSVMRFGSSWELGAGSWEEERRGFEIRWRTWDSDAISWFGEVGIEGVVCTREFDEICEKEERVRAHAMGHSYSPGSQT
jgi:hypothetical protein